jgi:creatinine amidohydrolase
MLELANLNSEINGMTWQELSEALKRSDIAILPVGSVEQHGPHLPLSSDQIVPMEIARRVAKRINALIAPIIPWGDEWAFIFKEWRTGTFHLRPETMINLVEDICNSLIGNGLKKIIIINGHGGNPPHISLAAEKVVLKTGAKILAVNWWMLHSKVTSEVKESKWEIHAGELETSVVLAARPDLVHMDRAVAEIPKMPYMTYPDNWSGGDNIGYLYPVGVNVSASGVFGDPSKASKEKGEKIIDAVVENIVTFVEREWRR